MSLKIRNIAAVKKHTLLLLMIGLSFSFASAQESYIAKVDKILEKGDTAKAVKKLNGFIMKNPKSTDLYLKRAKLKLERGDLEPAMVDLNSHCSLNKECGEADLLKGIIRFKQGDYSGAIAYLSTYTQEHDRAEAWSYLGQSHMWLQNYPVAVNAFRKAIAIQPKDVSSIYNAGLSAYYNEYFGLADSFFVAALAIAPEDGDIMLAHGLTLLRSGNHIESNKVFRTFEEDSPHYANALYNIGVNYYNLNEKSLACDYWTRSMEQGHMKAESSKQQYCRKKR